MESSIKTVEDIISLYEEFGQTDYIREEVSQIEHAIQAFLAAKDDTADDESAVGALLHDIGHLIGMKFDLDEMEN